MMILRIGLTQALDSSRSIHSALPASSRTGDTGLEVRSHGVGSPLPVGVYHCLRGGDLRDYLPGTLTLRYTGAN